MTPIEPGPQHRWLQRLVGSWTCEGEATMQPGEPPTTWSSSETVRSVGGLWFLAEGQGEMPGGGTAVTVMTLGYDPARSRYVGSFLGSMMTHLWVYEGELDAGGQRLTLDTEGPGMAPGSGQSKYRDVIEFKSDDHRTLTSYQQQADGEWTVVMTAHYRRQA